MLQNRRLNKFIRTAAAAVVLSGGASLAACGAKGSESSEASAGCDKTYTVGFSHPVGETQYVKALKKVVSAVGKENCTQVLLDSTTANNLETQRATVEGWVTQKVDAIVLWPVDPAAFANLEKQAQSQDIKWLTYVAPMDGQDGSVGFDSKQAGGLIADDMTAWVNKRYPDGGVDAAVMTLSALPTLEDRWKVPTAALKRLALPIVSTQDCADQTCGLQIIEDALKENPNIRVIVGLNDDAALGAQKAVENAGLKPEDVYISGYDGSPEGLANIRAGKGAFRATTAIPVQALGTSIVKNSIAAVTGEGESSTETPSILITPADTAKIGELLAGLKS